MSCCLCVFVSLLNTGPQHLTFENERKKFAKGKKVEGIRGGGEEKEQAKPQTNKQMYKRESNVVGHLSNYHTYIFLA